MKIRLHIVRPLAAGSAIMAVLATGQVASADTLADAISLAYSSNPTLQGARAQLRALDENMVQARSGYGLQVSASASLTASTRPDTSIFSPTFGKPLDSNTGAAALTVAQPLYTGGRVDARVKTASGEILAGQQQLRGVEANILIGVITAYADVLRDQRALVVRQASLETFRKEVEEVTARQKAGEVTITDVAQAQSQYESERSLVSSALAQLQASRASYAATVGQNPGQLAPLPPLPGLPATLDDALASADQNNPTVLQVIGNEQASRARIAQARAEFLPQISARADLSYNGVANSGLSWATKSQSSSASLTFSQPLFEAGQRSSQVRQAQARNDSDRTDIEAARRTAVQNTMNAWNAVITERQNQASSASAVVAAQRTFNGMQIEYRADLRSTYEVLNAEQTLANAELNQLVAEHDGYVAQAKLLAYTGRLEGPLLIEKLTAYDAKANLNNIANDGGLPTDIIGNIIDRVNIGSGKVRPVVGPSATPLPVDLKQAAVAPPATTALGVASPPVPVTPSQSKTAKELGLRLKVPGESDPRR